MRGGQFGLILATGTTATFNNVNYYSVVQPEIASITVEGAQMNEKFDPDVHATWAAYPNGTTSVNITAECTEGLVLSIGNTTATSGQPVNVALGEDYNTIKVVARDPESAFLSL